MSSRTITRLAPVPWQPGLEGEYPGQESLMELGEGPDNVPLLFCWCPPTAPGLPVVTDGENHSVNIPQGFWLAKHPVSQRQWQAVMGERENPSHFKGPDNPVDSVSWHDAQAFCQKAGLRLPQVAEWEHACRAGTTTPFAVGTGTSLNAQQANFDGGHPGGEGRDAFEWLSRGATLPAGAFPPNAWGLHDMHGQLWEWCEDAYAGDFGPRVLRGGSWILHGRYAASSFRSRYTPGYRLDGIGFRPCPSSIQVKAGGRRKGAERGKE